MLQLSPSPLKVDAPKKPHHGGDLLPLMKQCHLDPTTDLRPFCCNELLSDVVIDVSGTPFFAHRIVLAAASPRYKHDIGMVVKKFMCCRSALHQFKAFKPTISSRLSNSSFRFSMFYQRSSSSEAV
jgi:hypothetical protein